MGKRWARAWVVMAGMGMVVCLAGCSKADAVKAASTIHAYLPMVMGLAGDAADVVGALDPAEASEVQTVGAKVQTDLQELEIVSGAYAAAPSTQGWSNLGSVVDALVSDADQGLLAALAIKNPDSQAKAKVVLSTLDAAVHVLDGYLLAAQTPDEAKASAVRRASSGAAKLQSVVRCWSPADWQRVEQAFGARGEDLLGAEMKLGF